MVENSVPPSPSLLSLSLSPAFSLSFSFSFSPLSLSLSLSFRSVFELVHCPPAAANVHSAEEVPTIRGFNECACALFKNASLLHGKIITPLGKNPHTIVLFSPTRLDTTAFDPDDHDAHAQWPRLSSGWRIDELQWTAVVDCTWPRAPRSRHIPRRQWKNLQIYWVSTARLISTTRRNISKRIRPFCWWRVFWRLLWTGADETEPKFLRQRLVSAQNTMTCWSWHGINPCTSHPWRLTGQRFLPSVLFTGLLFFQLSSLSDTQIKVHATQTVIRCSIIKIGPQNRKRKWCWHNNSNESDFLSRFCYFSSPLRFSLKG